MNPRQGGKVKVARWRTMYRRLLEWKSSNIEPQSVSPIDDELRISEDSFDVDTLNFR